MFGTLRGASLRRRRIIVAVLVVVVVLAAIGAGLTLTRPIETDATTPPASIDPTGQPEMSPGDGPAQPVELAPVAETADPEAFAESVARALFEWDTTAAYAPSDHTGRLLAVADPTGEESPGLVADLAGYLPTAEAWAVLRPYYTRQWLEVATVEVPDRWGQALSEAGSGGLAPGTTAYTVTGTRHRSGIWEGEPVTSEHPVAFTAFVVCEPSYPTCHLLRLSRLGEPLE